MDKHSVKNNKGGAVCAQAKRCGACSAVNVPYGLQLEQKNVAMQTLFAAYADVLQPILGMEKPWHYRNKVVSPFAPGKKGEILTGMYAAGTHRLVNTDGCVVENEAANAVVKAIRTLMRRYHMEPYHEDTGRGFVRHVVVRVGHGSGEMLVTLVTNGFEFTGAKNFCRELVKKCPCITTIVQNINTRNTNVILGDEERTLYGPGFILDTLCGLSFRISSKSFYQVNAVQTEVLYRTAVAAAQLSQAETVVDAYCGTGTIGLVAATTGAAAVVGVDSVASAIADARQNAVHNGIENAHFVCADATEFFQFLGAECHTRRINCNPEVQDAAVSLGEVSHDSGDVATFQAVLGATAADTIVNAALSGNLVVMMDPPRMGSTPEFLRAVATLGPAKIAYVSCNPKTLLRDMNQLELLGYRADSIQPIDMFPHTPHVECVVLLSRL